LIQDFKALFFYHIDECSLIDINQRNKFILTWGRIIMNINSDIGWGAQDLGLAVKIFLGQRNKKPYEIDGRVSHLPPSLIAFWLW
jgi:hypothetical protein